MLTSIFRQNGINLQSFVILIAYLIVILTAIILHELSHGYIAYLNGDTTAKDQGRLTLNPMKHLSLVGFIMMLFVGFGWAKPVPIDPRNFTNFKKGMIQTSIAGVVCNLILAFISSICLAVFLKLIGGVTTSVSNAKLYALSFLLYLFYFSMQVNILLMVFNLLPIYPLDGFRVIETLSEPNNKFVDFMYRYGNFVMIAFLAISYLSTSLGGQSLFSMVNDLTRTVFNSLWGAILGVSI